MVFKKGNKMKNDNKKSQTRLFYGLIFGIILIGILSIYFVSAPSINPKDNRTIGYEFINDSVHIWNTQDDYYFNKTSGIQFTNHYDDYWTHNVFCIGYYNGTEWIKIKCADELGTFNKTIDTDNLTYVNATLWKDFTYNTYDFRLGIRYNLETNDEKLSVIVYGKNIDTDSIPFDLGFAWKIQDVEIPYRANEDSITINRTSYKLGETYDITFSNMTYSWINTTYNNITNTSSNQTIHVPIPNLRMFDTEQFLTLDWNSNLDYKVKIHGDGNQDNFYAMLMINASRFSVGQEKSTILYWKDAVGDYANKNWTINESGNYPWGNTIVNSTGEQLMHLCTYYQLHDVYYMNGTYKERLENVPANPCYGMAFDGTYLWAGQQGTDTIFQILPNGTYTGISYDISTRIIDISGVAADSSYIYVSDITAKSVVIFSTADGSYVKNWTANTSVAQGAIWGDYIYLSSDPPPEVPNYYIEKRWKMNGTIVESYLREKANLNGAGVAINGSYIFIADYADKIMYLYEGPGEISPDITPPIVNITYPLNRTYNIAVSELNYTTNDTTGSCWYSKDKGVTNSTAVAGGTNWTLMTSVEGSNNWTVWCNDTIGNTNSSSTIFYQDSIYPQINITYPINNSNLSSATFSLNYTFIEANPGFCWYSNDSGAVNSSTVVMGTNWTLTGVEGLNNRTVYCNDTANNINSSFVRFTIDTIYPQINITYPLNITYNINVSNLNYTFTETNPSRCWYSNSSGNWNSTSVSAGTNFTNVISVGGSNTWEVYCNDTSGNENSTSITFYVNKFWFNSGYPYSNNSFRITEFINRSGLNFTLGELPYRIIGADSYYLADYGTNHTYDDSGNEINNSREAVLEILNEAHYLNINVIRTWAGMSGGNGTHWIINNSGGHHNLFEVNVVGNYSEEMFASLDWVIYEASKRDIRLQLVLINNWNEYGGMRWYVMQSPTTDKTYQWINDTGNANYWKFHDQFYNDTNTMNYYRNYINYTLNRNNTYSGLLYKNDPAIFAWLLANEPRAKSDNGGAGRSLIRNWTINMTAYIKSIDSNHLVGLGIEGFGEPFEGTDMIADHNGTGVDFATFELHPEQWDWFAQRSENATNEAWVIGGITSNITLDWWTNGSGYSWNNRYDGSYVPDYVPALARHGYQNWVQQNVNWSNQLNLPVLLQELALPTNTALTESQKDRFYNQTISNFFDDGGDGIMFWNLNHDNYYYSTTPYGIMDDNYSFYVSDNATLKTKSQAVIDAFNFTMYGNNGGSWVTYLNNYKYDFTVNIDKPSDITIDNCTINFNVYNGTYRNITLVNSSGITPNTNYIFTHQFNYSDNNFTWYSQCCADDYCSNSNTSTILLGGEGPVVSLISPLNNSYKNNPITLIYNVTDDIDISYCELYINDVLNATDTTVTKEINQNFTITLSADGSYTWYIKCVDIGDTFGTSDSRTFTLDSTFPLISIIYPANNTNTSNTQLNVNYTRSDTNLDSCWYTKNLGVTNNTLAGCINITGVTWSEGINNITVYVNDSANNVNSSSITFYIDTINPQINLTYPLNITYNINVSALNYTVSDLNLDSCWYSINNGATNTSVTCETNLTDLTSTEGSNTWLVGANDSANNQNISRITFFKDTIFPTINFTDPTETNNSYLSRTYIYVNVTSTDTNLANITINLYNSDRTLNQSNYSTTSPFFKNYTSLADGIYYFNSTSIDTALNQNSTLTRTITIDTTNPLISYGTNTAPDYSNLSQSFIYVNVSFTETNFANITFTLKNNTNTINATTFTTPTYTINWTGLADNNYTYYVNITDSANNQNSTAIRNIRLDTTNPVITLISPTSGSEDTDGTVDFSFNVTDDLPITNCTIYLSGTDTSNTYSSTNLNITKNITQTFTVTNIIRSNNLNWFVNCTDSLNHVGNSSIWTLDTQIGSDPPINPGTGGGGGGGSYTPSINLTACELSYKYLLNHNYTDENVSELKTLLQFKGFYISESELKSIYFENWQEYCSSLTGLTLKPKDVCEEIYYFLKLNNGIYYFSDLIKIQERLFNKVDVSLGILETYINNYDKLCYDKGYSQKITSQISNPPEQNKTICNINIGNFLDFSIPLGSWNIGGNISCDFINFLKYFIKIDYYNNLYHFEGIKIIIFVILGGVILLIILIKKRFDKEYDRLEGIVNKIKK